MKGLPTNEVFDLLVDKKGYLWIGHDMGVSRYDGVSFTHFAHPQRSSLSCTDLVEDPMGRIWYHNFTGQVFYIEQERVNWLREYDNEAEESFPRMALMGTELIVTSKRGLFICNTQTLQSRYEKAKDTDNSAIKSLAVIGNAVLGFNIDRWFVYQPKHGLQTVSFNNAHNVLGKNRNLVLQPTGVGDTAFMLANPSGTVYKIAYRNGGLQQVGELHVSGFINSINALRQQTWVHEKTLSNAYIGDHLYNQVKGLNISDMAIDGQGNTWVSSLSRGLLIRENKANYFIQSNRYIGDNNLVTALHLDGNGLMTGTEKGTFFWMSAQGRDLIWQYQFPRDVGRINLIQSIGNDHYLISTSMGTFRVDLPARKVYPYFAFITKELIKEQNHVIIVSAVGLFSFPRMLGPKDTLERVILGKEQWNEYWQRFTKGSYFGKHNAFFWYQARCRSLAQTPDKQLYVSLMNGIHVFSSKGVYPMHDNGARIYSNSMLAIGGKLYIGSLNKGVMILSGGRKKWINTTNGLFSNSVIRLKQTGKLLWVILDRGVQVIDLSQDKIINDIALPQESGSNIFDVVTHGDTALMATSNGMYHIAMKPSRNYNMLHSELKLLVVQNSDSIAPGSSAAKDLQIPLLKYWQNDLEFHLSVPWYNPTNNLYFRYRLAGENKTGEWYSTQPGERIIRFASLMPGTYTFESYAVVAGFQEKVPVRFQFTITKPWWKSNLFTVGIILLAGGLFFIIYRLRLAQVLHLEQVRRSISSDLHDEIGSTISSINIYSELARSERDNEPYLTLIQENTRDVITKLDDLVWSINPKNDSMEQLVARMRLFAEPILAGAGIQLQFAMDPAINGVELPLTRKRNLYLMFKELVNNVVKHSRAKTCLVQLYMRNGLLLLVVKDDGIGLSNGRQMQGRSGMFNLSDRASQSKALFDVQTPEEGGTVASISMPIK